MGALPSRLRNAFERGGEMGARMSRADWSATAVGDPSAWPPELVDAVVTMLASRAQIVVFWGPEHVTLYNDAYIATLGGRHPGSLGRPGHEAWPEAWTVQRELLDGVLDSDSSFWARDHPFRTERHGFPEEAYLDVSYDPIRSGDGTAGGVMCIVSETTDRVLGERRMRALSAGLVDAAAAVNAVPTTREVLAVAARHVRAMTSAGLVVLATPEGRAESDGGADAGAPPDAVLPLPDTDGAPLGELRVWSGPTGPADPAVLTQFARLVGLRLANARLYETEHRIASTLQHSLLPQSLPRVPGALVAGRYVPGSSEAPVGGDWYDVIPGPDGELFLVIGDVVGKGVQAAAGMGQLRNALRAYLLEGFDCGTALSRLNRLVDTLGRRQFATVLCVGFDPRTRRVRFSSAGHPSPVLIPPGEPGAFLHDTALGPPIGALGTVTYPTREAWLTAGTRLLLYTDGLIEDRRRSIDEGLAALTADVAKPTEHIDDLLDTLLAKSARHARSDDIALLAMEVTEPREFVLRLPAEAGRLIVMRRRLEDFLAAHDVPEADAFDLVVAVSEAAANAVEHPVDPLEPAITVSASLQPDAVLVTVRDTGSWRPAPDAGFRGRGLALIGALTELSVHRSAEGTEVTLRRPISRPGTQGSTPS